MLSSQRQNLLTQYTLSAQWTLCLFLDPVLHAGPAEDVPTCGDAGVGEWFET